MSPLKCSKTAISVTKKHRLLPVSKLSRPKTHCQFLRRQNRGATIEKNAGEPEKVVKLSCFLEIGCITSRPPYQIDL
jgi:hypothetical protein